MNRNHECILAVYEAGSFSKAAEQLFVSQPALSLIVRKTEEEIGAMIFNRSYKPIRLTPAGEYYVEYIRKLAEAEQELTTRLNELREREDGTLFIGGSNFFCSYQLPEVFEKFKEKYPNKSLWVWSGFLFDRDLKDKEILNYIDVLVDGQYKDELHNPLLKWRGSSNQRVINVKESLKKDKIVILED